MNSFSNSYDAILQEFGAYYLSGELSLDESSLLESAKNTADRFKFYYDEENLNSVIKFLNEIKIDKSHKILSEIENHTLFDWRDYWPQFQQLIEVIILFLTPAKTT